MISWVRTYIWGEMPKHEVEKSCLLGRLFALIIGSFWILGSVQTPLFYHIVGSAYYPQANLLAFFFILPFLFFYLFFLEHAEKTTTFLLCTVFYALFFAGSFFALMHPTIGLLNTQADVHRIFGWALYAVIKTYGSVMVTIFWSFATSLTSFEYAKRSFPFIFFCGQMGSLLGSSLVRWGYVLGIPFLVCVAVFCVIRVVFIVRRLHTSFPLIGKEEVPTGSGIFEGLRLLAQRSELRHIFVVSTFALIITAFVDYQMHHLAHIAFPRVEDFASFKGYYGQVVSLFTLICSLGVTQWVLRKVGISAALIFYPLLVAGLVGMIYCNPSLWPVVVAMVLLRGVGFALNNPAKEMLYIDQSSDVRFKAKSWIDMIGYRSAFAIGSQVTDFLKDPFEYFIFSSSIISLGVIGVWLYSALKVTRR